MANIRKIPRWVWLTALFLVCFVVYGLLADWPRQMVVYSDELRYLHTARSLWQGRGLRVRNLPSDYQKILYPLCLMPALALHGTAAQLRATGWINAAWMASTVFPTAALARRAGLEKRAEAVLLLITMTLPTMVATNSFMSETVFLPLSLWMVLWLVCAMQAAPRARIGWCALAGGWCYLLYLNKEVALYYLIAYGLTRVWWLWHHRSAWRAEVASWAALLGSFLLCFVLAKATLFAGMGNSYNLTSWPTAAQWRYIPFALLYDALFAVLGFGVLPLLLPMAHLKRPRAETGRQAAEEQLPLMLLLCVAVGIATVAYTITIREDLGRADPRQHLRYMEPLMVPLLLCNIQALRKRESTVQRRVVWAGTAVFGVLFVAVCHYIGPGSNDNTFLQWYDFVTDRLNRLPVLPESVWLLLFRLGIVAGLAALCCLVLRRRALPVLAAGLVAVQLFCYWSERRINLWTYAIAPETARAADALNETLHTLPGNILFVPYGVRQKDSQLIDSYIDRDVYLCEFETMQQRGFLEDGVLDLATEHPVPEFPNRPYEDLREVQWLLLADGVAPAPGTAAPVDAATPAGYTLYQNLDPARVALQDTRSAAS